MTSGAAAVAGGAECATKWKWPSAPHDGAGHTMLFNSLTKAKEPVPRGAPLTWYTCGPTVYDHAHIGHARAYVALDIVRRVLLQQGHCVFQVMGMTDIDDKIIAKAKVRARTAVGHNTGARAGQRGVRLPPRLPPPPDSVVGAGARAVWSGGRSAGVSAL